MAKKVSILATRRTVTGKQVGVLRRAGKLPAVLYGRHLEATRSPSICGMPRKSWPP